MGAAFVGVHMALTHGVTLGMVASYIPATEIKGIGRITGTCWSFTDFIFGTCLSPQQGHCMRLSAALFAVVWSQYRLRYLRCWKRYHMCLPGLLSMIRLGTQWQAYAEYGNRY